MELTKAERHVVLYAKCHYAWNNISSDIATLLSEEYDIEPEKIFRKALYEYVINLYEKLYNGGFLLHSLTGFLKDLFDDSNQKFGYEEIMEKLIRRIQGIAVLDDNHERILELGEADESLLPLSENMKPKKLLQNN